MGTDRTGPLSRWYKDPEHPTVVDLCSSTHNNWVRLIKRETNLSAAAVLFMALISYSTRLGKSRLATKFK